MMAEERFNFSRRQFIKSSAAAWAVTALGPYTKSLVAASVSGLSAGEFLSPPISARPMVLWAWLNGYVDREQLTRELEEMRAKGLRGPILWDVASIRDPAKTVPAGPPFLGEESVDSMRHALDEASRLGLEAGLFASCSWNAGGPWIGPELASKQLAWTELEVSGPGTFSDVIQDPKDFESPYEGEEPYELKAPFQYVALLAVPKPGSGAEAVEPVDLTDRVDGSGRLTWEIPAGDWTIFRFVCAGTGQTLEIPSPNSDGLIVDHMSAEATDRHFEVMLGRLFRDGKRPEALRSLMLDSFEVREAPDWTPSFVDEFLKDFGYDPRPWMPVLAGRTIRSAELSERFEHDYRVLVSRLMIKNHFARSAEILEKHDLELLAEAGHGGFPRVDTLEALGSSHIPMGEFWNGMQFWVTKEAASAAHIYGRKEVAAESLTGWRHWQDGPAEYKRLFDLAFCAGLNSGVFHTFAHNPPEAGKPGYAYHAGEHFNINSTWWEQSGPMLEYLSRCSHLLRQGQFVADVCFYYGDQAPNLVPSRRIDPKVTPPHDEGECRHCGRPLPNRIDSLGAGYDFDYVNRDIVTRDMQVRDGRLVLSSGMEYRMIVLPDRDDIALPVLRKIEELVRDGATLVGRPPQRANSLEDYPHCDDEVRRLSHLLWGDGSSKGGRRHGKGRVFPEVALRDVLGGMGLRPDFSVESPAKHDLDYIHRRTENENFYFVINSADEPVEAECSFRVAKGSRPFLWNAEDGSISPCPVYRFENGAIRMPLKLEQISSVFVVFKTGEAARDVAGMATDGHRSATAGESDPLPDIALTEPWVLEFPAGGGAPASIELEALKCWTELGPEGARVFSGTARYTTSIHVPDEYTNRVLELDLGLVAEVAEVSVNGQSTDVAWKPPYRVDVTGLLKTGTNHIEVKATNLWHNRIVGDLRHPEAGEFAPTSVKHRFSADMELLRSGLLGPVVLRQKIDQG